jgi:hypothetical protein
MPAFPLPVALASSHYQHLKTTAKKHSCFEGSVPPVRYIVGVRMRRQKEVNLAVLGHRGRWFESVPERQKPKDPAPLKVKEVWVEARRYVVCLK